MGKLRWMQASRGEGKTFTAPALAEGWLYVRNSAGEVICLQTCPGTT